MVMDFMLLGCCKNLLDVPPSTKDKIINLFLVSFITHSYTYQSSNMKGQTWHRNPHFCL